MSSIAMAVSLLAVGCVADEGTQRKLELADDDIAADDHGAAGGSTVGSLAVVKLTADLPDVAPNIAPSMRNPWGIVRFDQKFWTANEATGVLSILDGNGVPSAGPPASGAIELEEGITGIAVTGVSAKEGTLFQIHEAGICKPARLIVASESGKLWGVNPDVSTTSGFVVVDRSNVGATYKGVTVILRKESKQGKRTPLILAADFRNARIDVFDANFALVTDVSFEARGLPKGFAPFNVMALGDMVYVTYAKQDPDGDHEVTGAGLGYVAVFDLKGKLKGLAKGSELDAPWGMELACNFGPFRNALLVGNFGDGTITALHPVTMKILGQLKGDNGQLIKIDGLWGIALGFGISHARADALYFAAGPVQESHGLFGAIAPSPDDKKAAPGATGAN